MRDKIFLTICFFQFAEIISSFNAFINEIDDVRQSSYEKMESSAKSVGENSMEKIGSDHTPKIYFVDK